MSTEHLPKDTQSMPIGEYIAELEKDPVWKAEIDLARTENMTNTQAPSKEKSMKRYRLTAISPLGQIQDADPMEAEAGKWYSAEEADLYVARLKWEHESIEQMQREIKQKLDDRVAELESQVATLERSNKRLREKIDRRSH